MTATPAPARVASQPPAPCPSDSDLATLAYVCDSCHYAEPAEFMGERTRARVRAKLSRFVDRQGFLYCRWCFVIGGQLAPAAEVPDDFVDGYAPAPKSTRDYVGANAGFNPREASDHRRFAQLARRQMPGGKGVEDQMARVNDVEALCTIAELPPDVTEAVKHHVWRLSDDRRDARGRRRGLDFRTCRARYEAFLIATVTLVMERWRIDRPGIFDRLCAAFAFKKAGREHLLADEYQRAENAARSFFQTNLWRDRQSPPGASP